MTARMHRAPLAVRILSILLAAVFATSLAPLRSAIAAAVDIPADPAADGFIGLCGVDGKPMTGGSIHDQPFVWKAISSVPPQAEAQGKDEVATLYVVQPRPGAPASDWNGEQLTATDPYSTPNAPTAQSTKLDYPLSIMVNDFPPMVNGLYELRLYVGNEENTAFLDKYPATFIQVNGDRWSVVQGGTVDCSAGQAVSTEVRALGTASAGGTPSASAPYGGPSGTGVPKNANGVPVSTAGPDSASPLVTHTPVQSSSRSDVSDNSVSPSSTASPNSVTPLATSASPGAGGQTVISATGAEVGHSGVSASLVAIVVIVAAVIVSGGGWLIYRRRRRSGAPA